MYLKQRIQVPRETDLRETLAQQYGYHVFVVTSHHIK